MWDTRKGVPVPVLGLKAAHDGTFYGIVVVAQRGNLENRHCVLILACAITKDGEAQQWRAVATIIAVLVAAYFFEWARILMAVIFLVSFLHFAWTQLKG